MYKLQWKNLTSEKRIPETRNRESEKFRSEMESDFHRIIRSASFRRLQDKTQVFPLDNSDFVRTRLTHSLEVSSLARLIGKQVCEKIIAQNPDCENLPDTLKVIETLNCASLLHDIGNPPFGHFGEFSIREWFSHALKEKQFLGKPLEAYLTPEQKLDFLYYEGNAQAFRIINHLHSFQGHFGMHLTCAVMDTIVKYPFASHIKKEPQPPKSLFTKKIGCFQSEAERMKELKSITGTVDTRNPMCFILEAADDLAYTFADLEDGFNKGLYQLDELIEVLKQAEDEKGAELLGQYFEQGKIHRQKDERVNPYDYAVTTWLSRKQLFCVSEITDAFLSYYDDIMNGTFEQELIGVSSQKQVLSALKRFAYQKVYSHNAILKIELMGNEIITFLLERFVDALIPYDSEEQVSEINSKYIALLSDNYLSQYHEAARACEKAEDKLYYRLLLAADFISGMSDSYAKNLYQQLKGY